MGGFEPDVSSKDLSFTKSAYKTKLKVLNGFANMFRRIQSEIHLKVSFTSNYIHKKDNCKWGSNSTIS
jgi:hypothetical protein